MPWKIWQVLRNQKVLWKNYKTQEKSWKVEKEDGEEEDEAEEEEEVDDEDDDEDDNGVQGLPQEEYKIEEIEKLREERLDLFEDKEKISQLINDL